MVSRKRIFMLDTNIVTYIVTSRSAAARSRYTAEEGRARIVISAVTEGEILYGLAKNPQAARRNSYLQHFLEGVEVLPWDSSVTPAYGQLRASLQAMGALPSPLDLMIAAHASSLHATLVTHDRSLKRLKDSVLIEDWTADL